MTARAIGHEQFFALLGRRRVDLGERQVDEDDASADDVQAQVRVDADQDQALDERRQHQDAGAKMVHVAPNTTSTIVSVTPPSNPNAAQVSIATTSGGVAQAQTGGTQVDVDTGTPVLFEKNREKACHDRCCKGRICPVI